MYGKLFVQMYDGTLATKGPWEALVTFQQMIILADKGGIVDMTPEAIARRTTLPLEIVAKGIAALLQADPQSRSPGEDGRRIVPLSETRDWGWRIVNHEFYRAIRSNEERREYMRKYQQKRRAAALVNQDVNNVNDFNLSSKQEAVSKKQLKTLSGKPDAAIKNREFKETAVRLLDFLNRKTGKAFEPVPANLDLIVGRLKEGYSEQDCKTVIARKLNDWANDDKMRQYLRPQTLFNRTKFAAYKGECVEAPSV